jgi:arginyl-tRNA synthetase
MIFGDTICNILEFSGNSVVRANYIGDVGLHVIQWLWNYQKYHAGEEPPADVTRWMGDLYAEAVQRLEDHPEFEPEVRELFARWDRRDPQVIHLWKETRQWSLDGFNEIYNLMGINFEHFYYESDVEDSGKEIVAQLIDKGIATDERPEGPVIVKIDELLGLEKEQYRTFVILRSDGTSLYATKDLSLGLKKFEDFDLSLSLYIVDVRQSLHFQQVFKTLELAGYKQIEKAWHIPYEIVNLPGNVTMSSREGTVVLLEDLIRETTQRAKDVVKEKNPALTTAQQGEVANAVALGAIKYPMLARDNTKVATFDWESALDFNGQAAPYIQYAHVRANSILRRLEEPLPQSAAVEHQLEPTEIELIELITRLPDEVQRAAAEYKTLHIASIAYQLAKAFNEFYNQCPVLQAEPPLRAARLRLVAAAKQAIANCLDLLGITAPEFM